MVKSTLYLEGGGDSKELHARCREGFRKLLEGCGFSGRMPRLVACGSRGTTYDDFTTAHACARQGEFVAMLVDSEDPVADIEKPWEHLSHRDGWRRPDNAENHQVLMMTTSMETWIVADRDTLRTHYGTCLQKSALPALNDMESRRRDVVQNALVQATRTCANKYAKGKRSFELLGKLSPARLDSPLLPSFQRALRILREKL